MTDDVTIPRALAERLRITAYTSVRKQLDAHMNPTPSIATDEMVLAVATECGPRNPVNERAVRRHLEAAERLGYLRPKELSEDSLLSSDSLTGGEGNDAANSGVGHDSRTPSPLPFDGGDASELSDEVSPPTTDVTLAEKVAIALLGEATIKGMAEAAIEAVRQFDADYGVSFKHGRALGRRDNSDVDQAYRDGYRTGKMHAGTPTPREPTGDDIEARRSDPLSERLMAIHDPHGKNSNWRSAEL